MEEFMLTMGVRMSTQKLSTNRVRASAAISIFNIKLHKSASVER